MTKLKAINIFFFQWFFARLTRYTEERITNYKIISFDLMPDNSIGSRGIGIIIKHYWYGIQYWILPTTGWKSDFIYLNKVPKFIKITKEKEVNK